MNRRGAPKRPAPNRPMSCVSGDNLDEALRSVWPGLRAYVLSLLAGRREQVDDVLQETALFIWNNREKLAEIRSFNAWAFRIAYFKAQARRRDLARDRSTVFSEELFEKLAEEAETRFSRGDRLAALGECVKKMPDDARALLVWRYVDNRPLTELARNMGRSADSIHQRICRLRRALRACMEKSPEIRDGLAAATLD